MVKFKQKNPAFKRFAIYRADVNEDKFTGKVGTPYAAAVNWRAVIGSAIIAATPSLAKDRLRVTRH